MTNNNQHLLEWGWSDFFSDQEPPLSPEQVARVVKEQRDHYLLINGLGQLVGGIISGNWKKRRDDFENPSVGDWVTLKDQTDVREGITFFRIDSRLRRFSQIIRKAAGPSEKNQLLAANVNVAFLVSSSNQDLDLRRLERYLALLGEDPIRAVLVLTKCDLPSSQANQDALTNRFPHLPLITTRSDQPESVLALERFLGRGITSVFLGSSGVGKSTLTNILMGSAVQKVQDIRENDAKGRHTTTGRSMYLLSGERGLIVDTPGLREIQLPSTGSNLEEAFPDILELSLKCRFANCLHQTEPSCAVKEAVSRSEISQERLSHFQKLRAEASRKPSYKK